jgi:hypothetical protein
MHRSDLVTPELPIPLSEVESAFNLPGDLEMVAFHRGIGGAWQVRSPTGGQWSLKVLPFPAPTYQIETLQTAGRLEGLALAAGLEIVPPVKPPQPTAGLATLIDAHLVWLHRWMDQIPEGERLPIGTWLGQTAARLHALWPIGCDHEASLAHAYGIHDQADWRDWLDQGDRLALPWVQHVRGIMPAIAEATALATAALSLPNVPRCMSHRDLNPPNILHTPDGPLLCDFGSSGCEAPWFEIVDASLSFDQAGPGMLEAYRRAGGQTGPTTSEALARHTSETLGFLAFIMWLSLGHRERTQVQRDEATAWIPELVHTLSTQVESLEQNRRILFGR